MTGSPAALRDHTIDILRGLAIAMMVFGHLGMAIAYAESAFYLEMASGCAPTVFLIVAGMMVAHSVRLRGRPMRHFLARGAQILALAAALDLLIWRIVPFTTVDILYLIGVAIPVTALATRRLPVPALLAIAAGVLLLAPPLQGLLGYTDWPTEIPLGGETPEVIRLEGVGPVRLQNPTSILNHWIVDGWFPVFPWLGFVLLGAALSWTRWLPGAPAHAAPRRFTTGGALLPAALLLAAALALGWGDVGRDYTLRLRWGGAFMPPGWNYLLGSTGVFLLLGWVVDRTSEAAIWRPFRLVGANSLLTYLAHFAAVRAVAHLVPGRVDHPVFWALSAGVFAGLVGLAALWPRLRR